VCIELTFLDGDVEYVEIGPARPEIVSTGMSYDSDQSHERVQLPARRLGFSTAVPAAAGGTPNPVAALQKT